MTLAEINPCARFARIHRKELGHEYIVGLDHRAFYCIGGRGTIVIEETEYKMQKGAFLMIRAGVPYKVGATFDKMELYAVNFDMLSDSETSKDPIPYVKLPRFNATALAEPRENWPTELLHDVIYIPEFYAKKGFELIIEEYMGQQTFSRERCSALLKEIIILSAREALNKNPKSKSDQLLAYVRDHYREPLTNELVAAHFSYHKNYINSILKREMGTTLHAYLLSYRISEAIALLASGEYSATEVAELVGFSEYTHFSRTFKKITGRTPNDYALKRK